MEQRGVEVRSLEFEAMRLWDIPVAAWKLRRVFAELRPDIVHSLLFTALATGDGPRDHAEFPAVAARSSPQHDDAHPAHLHWRLIGKANHASHVIAVSRAVRETLIREGVAKDHVSVVYNGLDWEGAVQTDPAGVEAWRQRFPRSRIIVAAGRITFQKDWPDSARSGSPWRVGEQPTSTSSSLQSEPKPSARSSPTSSRARVWAVP